MRSNGVLFVRVLMGVILAGTPLRAAARPDSPCAPAAGAPRAATPADRFGYSTWWAKAGFWQRRIDGMRRQIETGPHAYDFVFCGDSITHNWEGWLDETDRDNLRHHIAAGRIDEPFAHIQPMPAWRDLQKIRKVLNLGISGDSTQHLLWRLTRGGLLKGYTARYFCVMIGTNNDDTPGDVAAGVRAIVAAIGREHPESVVLLHPIFPRAAGARHRRNLAANEILRTFADGTRVVWCDFNAQLAAPDGTASPELFPDGLHPNDRGYRVWAAAILRYGCRLPEKAVVVADAPGYNSWPMIESAG